MPLSDGIRPRRFPVVNVLIIRGRHAGAAFFAHIGGFVFGVTAATALVRAGKQQNVRCRLRPAT